jgi:hypothetical protein
MQVIEYGFELHTISNPHIHAISTSVVVGSISNATNFKLGNIVI